MNIMKKQWTPARWHALWWVPVEQRCIRHKAQSPGGEMDTETVTVVQPDMLRDTEEGRLSWVRPYTRSTWARCGMRSKKWGKVYLTGPAE